MKQRFFLGLTLVLAAGALVLLYKPSPQIDTEPEQFEARSEKSKIMANQGHPDKFAEYFAQVRQGPNGETYPLNYKLDALKKAQSARKTAGRQLPWIERGPGNVGGRTRALLVDPTDPTENTWFAGSVGGGIWHTTNAGATWRPLTDDLPNLAIGSLAQSMSNPDVIYAGTGEGFGNLDAVAGAGIFKSIDHGETWTQLEGTITPDYRAVNRLVVDPADENVVVAATNTGIFRSVDGGTTWLQVYDDARNGRVQDLRYQPGNFNVQFATDNGCCILRSTDAGETWEINYNKFFNGALRIELATSEANPDWVYAAAELSDPDRGGDIYFTMDGGDNWTLAEATAGTASNWLGSQGWYDNAIAVHPFSPDTVYMGGINFWRTNLSGSLTTSGGAPTALNEINTTSFLDFVSFTGGSNFGGRVDIGTVSDQLLNVTLDDMRSVEIRFGPGLSQKAHRFSVSPTGGANGDGGAGIPYASYIYEDYVDVPFEVWDIENNVQLMASFRDQADDGVYNLTPSNTSGPRDTQSREYIFVHGINYNATTPDPTIGITGGAGQKALYFMWPILAEGGTWDAANLPESQLQILFELFDARVRVQSRFQQTLETSGSVHVDHHNITMLPVNAATNSFKIINTNDGGVFYSENSGGIWKDANNGYVTTQFYDADKRAGTDDYIAGAQDNGTWRSFADPNVDTDWRSISGGDGFELFWHPNNINEAVYSFQNNNFLKTNNGGFTTTRATTGLTDIGGGGPFITALGWSKSRPEVLFAVGASGIWRSDNFADSWTLVQSIDESQWGFFAGCKVRVSIADPDIVWAGCRLGDGGTFDYALHLSRDGGQTFDPVPIPAGRSGFSFISGLATHPTSASTAYVLFSGPGNPKILRTENTGFTWEDISGFADATDGVSTNGFPDVAINDLMVLPNYTNEIWAATEVGIFSSQDNGESWSYADNGLPAVSVWRLRHVEDEVIAATHGRGVWTVSEPLFVSNEPEETPIDFELAQNYPNPFNPTTTIRFSIPAPTDVQLKVYDVSGREVATLTDGLLASGSHEVEWDARNFASGVYMYRLTAGEFTSVKQLTLLK